MTGRIVRRWAAALAVLPVVLAACLDAPVSSTTPTEGPTPEPTASVTSYQLDTTVWYAGLLIHVDGVTATLDERGGPVEVRLRLENPGEDEAELSARILLQLDSGTGEAGVPPNRESKIPSVPAHGLAGAVLTYELQGVPSVDRAVLLIGEAPLHVARVPLTAAGGAPVVFQPVNVDVSGAGAIKDLRVVLRHAVLRWDLPDWWQQLNDEVQALTLTYDATYTGDFVGGFAFTADNVRLRLPDGTWIVPRRDGHSQSIEQIGAGKTKKDLTSRFEIPAGTTGRFALIVRTGTNASKAIPFVLGG